jgi:long-chain acyl-CoA synthetase
MTIDDATSVIRLFVRRAATDGNMPALHVKRDGVYRALTWNELARDVRCTAAAFVRLGVQPGDRVIQVAENRYEWIVCDLAIQMAQAIHVPVHAPLTGEQIVYQINDSGARIVLLSGPQQAGKLVACAEKLTDEVTYFSFDRCDETIRSQHVRLLSDLTEDISDEETSDVEQRALASITADSLATILYTSGTTGEPKGVMLSQRNLVSNALATLEAFGPHPDELRLNFLPLSHIFARTCDLYTWIAKGSQLALAESRETVLADCAAVKPTRVNGVPYFFDKVRRILIEQGRADDNGSVRDLLGGNIRFCCSGGAALPDHVFDFFLSRGVPVLQGYGLTETSPVISVSTEHRYRRGTVGPPIPGVEVRIADDGEILTRGPHVMIGYWKNQQATDEVVRDGWLHTGDIGELEDGGFLRITGRKKELIVTSGGKNVAPVYLESLLAEDPLILQALVVGDGRNFLTALIVPNPDALRDEIIARGIAVTSRQQALSHPQVLELYEQCIRERLRGVSQYEQVRKFTLLDRGFTIESGELTPKMSLRREIIETNFADRIQAMYGG